jgi:hypothetical protein
MALENEGANAQENGANAPTNQPAIEASVAKTVSLNIVEAKVSRLGELTLICRPTAKNPSGVYVMRGGQTASVLRNAGCPTTAALVALVKKGGSKLTFRSQDVKLGQTFVNKATGEVGKYKQDWTKEFGHEVVFSQAVLDIIANEAVKAMFAAPTVSAPAPVYTEKVAKQPTSEENSLDMEDPDLG